MNCVICKTGRMTEGRTTVTLQRGDTTVVIKNVPARVCDNCAEHYLSEEMTREVLAKAEAPVGKGVEVEILRWAA
jgi:YgiT-type zinc finger domain-containing protein